jgi:hypothetical protein
VDRKERLKVDSDLRQVNDSVRLPDNVRARYEAERNAIVGELPGLKDQAIAADNHWSARIESHAARDQRHGLAGMYRMIYRHSSAVAHGTAYGLTGIAAAAGPGLCQVGVEHRFVYDPFRLAGVVYSTGLLIYAEAFAIRGMVEALGELITKHPDSGHE